jgi:hypothetical protein
LHLNRLVMGSAVALSVVGAGLMSTPVAAQDCVTIYGGDIMNETVIDLSANAGTAISDASAGSFNTAQTGGGPNIEGALDIASAGNGGVATAAASGGAISLGNINSGGNVGNAVNVGDTWCADVAPVYEDKKPAKHEEKAAAPAAGGVVALPDTGVGIGMGDVSGLFALLASAGTAAASLGLRRRS